jgi:hypothetical protein
MRRGSAPRCSRPALSFKVTVSGGGLEVRELLSFSDQLRLFEGGTLGAATNRRRFDALQELATLTADGGTELVQPLVHAADQLRGDGRQRTILLVTDGQAANEDQLLATLVPRLKGTRIFAVGIDQSVGAGLLNRLADVSGGHADLVESEERLDARKHRFPGPSSDSRVSRCAALCATIESSYADHCDHH